MYYEKLLTIHIIGEFLLWSEILPGGWWYKSYNRHKIAHIFTTPSEINGLREQYASLPKSSQRPPAQKGPQERVPGVGTASVFVLFFPLRFSASHTPSLCLLCSVPPAAPDTFIILVTVASLRPYFSSFPLFFLSLSFCLSFSSWMLMTSISLQLSCSWAKITDYREGKRERGFTFPENLNLSNLHCCDTWQPSQVSLFSYPSLLKEGAQPMQHAHAAPNQQRRIFLIFLWLWSL